ncbi:MAG: hypothetical protein US50_C0004G0017 [Candidatus Nomurabacteria bacterium GW2011_GWB1_37_5]|uniref:Uncharacterized protein n=1 Tax=Candidatus Nomurabacteria bacterium GW2011_GWB1_37_5 TaxID=1618742 RepID=A0A0G0GXX2_9BACT|nr:MAG: hypothetical protein US50_C0004G0017 [Candidatus Nomurabacteria bacterium GW2011_GWB1_37_5]
MKTLHGHFCHYYGNLGFIGKISALLDKKISKTRRAVSFGVLYHTVVAMPTSIEFVNMHKHIPCISKLSNGEQSHILVIEDKIQAIKDYFFKSKSREKYEDLLEKDNDNGIEKMSDEITDLWYDFQNKYNELKKFISVYD